jgi:putative endonuclease
MKRFLEWLGLQRGAGPAAPPGGAGATGQRGEREAEEFLRRKGFRVLARNWRSGREEIDLVCQDGEVLVFVEVKTRAAGALVPGYYTVDDRKKRALKRVCYAYMKRLRAKPATIRFDVMEVSVEDTGRCRLLHFENIPLFPKGYHG